MASAGVSMSGDIPFASVKILKGLGLSPLKEAPLQLPIKELNPYITCGICLGYLYEASTITECMHTFCKSCIVKHAENNFTCPLCDVMIHPTDPLSNIRLDRTLQDIVSKLVPGVVQEEKHRKEIFYRKLRRQKLAEDTLEEDEAIAYIKRTIDFNKNKSGGNEKFVVPSSKVKSKRPLGALKQQKHRHPSLTIPLVSLVLEFAGSKQADLQPLQKKFVRVQSDAKVANVLTFLRRKLSVPSDTEISMFCDSEKMTHELTLADIQQKYFQANDEMMSLWYTVGEVADDQWLKPPV